MLKIGIVDDHQLFRKSLALLVNTFEGAETVIEAENGKVFFEKLKATNIRPDIILLDIEMPEMDGFETCRIMHEDYPDVKILIVSQLTTKESIHKIMELGAHGYFTKNSDPEQLEFAIKSLNDKGYYFGMELGTVIREALLWQDKSKKQETDKIPFRPKPLNTKVLLSDREVSILRMASREYNSTEIAQKLCITVKTVESHRKRILEKTYSKNFIGAILYAIQYNYLTLEELINPAP